LDDKYSVLNWYLGDMLMSLLDCFKLLDDKGDKSLVIKSLPLIKEFKFESDLFLEIYL
jgi:hypothetical protein